MRGTKTTNMVERTSSMSETTIGCRCMAIKVATPPNVNLTRWTLIDTAIQISPTEQFLWWGTFYITVGFCCNVHFNIGDNGDWLPFGVCLRRLLEERQFLGISVSASCFSPGGFYSYSALHLDLQVFLQFVGQLIAVTFVHTGVINAFFTHIGSSQLVKWSI